MVIRTLYTTARKDRTTWQPSQPTKSNRATPWHADSAYWQDRLDKHDGIVTVWLALDRSTRENDTSPHRRCGYTMRYMTTSNRMIPENNRGHQLWLARGKDLAGNTYANA